MNDKKQGHAREGQKALAQYDTEGRAVRANMEKLRALRLAKEAADAAAAPPAPLKKTAAKKAGAKAKKAEPAKLSEWLADQQKGGFRT